MTPKTILFSLRIFWFRYSLTRATNRAAIEDTMSRHPAGKGKA